MPRSRPSSRQDGPGNGIGRPPGRHPAIANRSGSGKPDAAPKPGWQPEFGSRRIEAARFHRPGRQDEAGKPPAHPFRCISACCKARDGPARTGGFNEPPSTARNSQGPAGSFNAPGSSPDGHGTGGCRPCPVRPANALPDAVAGDDSHGDAASSDDGLSSGDGPIRNGGVHNDIARMGGRGPAGNR